jgi:hypothetical protein
VSGNTGAPLPKLESTAQGLIVKLTDAPSYLIAEKPVAH